MYTYIFIFVIVNDTVILLQGWGSIGAKGVMMLIFVILLFNFASELMYFVTLSLCVEKSIKKKKRLGAKKLINEMG